MNYYDDELLVWEGRVCVVPPGAFLLFVFTVRKGTCDTEPPWGWGAVPARCRRPSCRTRCSAAPLLQEGVVSHVAQNPDKFSAENIADVVRWRPGGAACLAPPVAAQERAAMRGARRRAPCRAVQCCAPCPAQCSRLHGRRTQPPTHPPPAPSSRQVYAFSRCGFCHPDLITVVETAAGTLLKEAAADRGYVSCGSRLPAA